MEESGVPAGPRRVHPLDLLALAVAAAAAVALYAFLFRRTEVPRPADAILGTTLEVDVVADYPWKREFPRKGEQVLLDELLSADVLDAADAPEGRAGVRRLRLRVRERSGQDPSAVLNFRWGIARGSRVSMQGAGAEGRPVSTVSGEVVSVEPPGTGR